jgi:single-stranded-DNA-specific exonuclease
MDRPFLDVGQSLTGRRWTGLPAEQERMAAAIALETGQPEILGRILARNGVTPAEARGYLDPMLRDLMPDPSRLRDMDKAAERFAQAVAAGQRIAVFADYDVDGGASAALILTWLRSIGRNATLYVPDRIDEGYGPNEPAMAALGRNHDLIICVDCGTLSFEPIAAADCDVIVLDHHLGGETLPPAVAVVNPNRQDESGDYSYLCAAGVVFLFLAAVNRLRRGAGETEPDLREMLDLVALATVADVAPLIGFNRALVRQGLKVMAGRRRPGLAALADVARLTSAPAAWHLGFMLGPRVNAGGRIGAADLGARLLSTADPAEAVMLAEKLDRLNTERRLIEAGVLETALAQAQARGDGPLAWAAGEGWHPGVVGIVAARLKEATGRPSVVIGLDGDQGKGSGRSVSGIDLGSAVAAVQREGLLLKGGGHPMAAGLTVARDHLDAAMLRLGELLARQGAGSRPAHDLAIDGLLAPAAATPDLIALLEKAGPFGQGAPAPRFAFAGLRVSHARRAGADHLQLSLTDGAGRLDAILFRAFSTPLGEALENHGGRAFHLAGHRDLDEWQGRRRAKLRLEDASPAR